MSLDPLDDGPAILGATWALTALSILVISLRFYVRIEVVQGLKAHDWVMLVALLLQIANQACITEAYRWGLGKHDQYLIVDPTMPWINLLKWIYISTVPGVCASIAARISVTLLLISLFGNKIWLKRWLITTTLLVAVLGILSIAITWAQASPVEGLWNPLLPARRLDPIIQESMVYLSGSVFALTDLTYALFPILIIRKLKMPFHRRLGLCVLMAGSLFSMAACIMRIVTAHHSNLHETALGMLWAGLEQCLVIILGTAPTLPAIRQMKLGFLRSFGTSLASLVERSPWRRGHSSTPGGKGSESPRSSGDEKAAPNAVICERAPHTTVDVEAASGTFSANNRNLYDSYEVMPDEIESEPPLRSASAYC
ncbi:hypothetical protein N8I77_001816 [Diaporthe amygdali]|uniref:Rhodopsin domain-containing protein n=1 Tax=Phomopsis amygdali TaxID=1214568 RepID=A0AAD9SST8_PHOAM|nr:hypothetical protein N8I77_001816 [Diaporthe amygdali]